MLLPASPAGRAGLAILPRPGRWITTTSSADLLPPLTLQTPRGDRAGPCIPPGGSLRSAAGALIAYHTPTCTSLVGPGASIHHFGNQTQALHPLLHHVGMNGGRVAPAGQTDGSPGRWLPGEQRALDPVCQQICQVF